MSHGGSGTALGALAAGLPQLCLPQGADQFLNAGAIAAGGAGIALLPNEATGDSIAIANERLLADASSRLDIASMPSVAEAAAALESLVEASAGCARPYRRGVTATGGKSRAFTVDRP